MVNVNMNEMMITKMKEINNHDNYLDIDGIVTEIVSHTRKIKDCIIFDKEGRVEEQKINFERIIKMVGDFTGYEASCNEIRLNQKEIKGEQFIFLAERLSGELAQRYDDRKMVIYIILHDDGVEVRFHTYREGEKPWLSMELNNYNIPILCYI